MPWGVHPIGEWGAVSSLGGMSVPLLPRSKSHGCLLFLLLKLLVLYVLSFGPVQALYSSQRLQGPVPGWLTTCYQPLHWLYENTPLGRPMAVYDHWWQQWLAK